MNSDKKNNKNTKVAKAEGMDRITKEKKNERLDKFMKKLLKKRHNLMKSLEKK